MFPFDRVKGTVECWHLEQQVFIGGRPTPPVESIVGFLDGKPFESELFRTQVHKRDPEAIRLKAGWYYLGKPLPYNGNDDWA